ncbi:lipid-A-disaccharide synthase, partial [Xanthomonas citri pv. citri]|nr:lipid-A-disaccharide synthase [Xanthomonas citri pv. citri]
MDVFIGIDVFDFNLGVECWLKECGIIMVYYVSLLVWVWCEKWVEKIGVSVDLVLCLFLMELLIYVKYGIDVCFVGYLM